MPDRSEQGVKRGRAATPPTVTPAAKRASIIEQIREAPNYAKDPREINSPDDLDEFEITECYKVALAAAKSIWPNAKVTSAMMESFLSIIFDNWTSNKSIGTLRIDEDLPEVCNARSNAVGHVPFKLPGPGSRCVCYIAEINIKDLTLCYWLEYLDESGDDVERGDDFGVKAVAASKVVWLEDGTRLSEYRALNIELWKQFMELIVPARRSFAIAYAQRMIHGWSIGLSAPGSARSLLIPRMPALEHMFPAMDIAQYAESASNELFKRGKE